MLKLTEPKGGSSSSRGCTRDVQGGYLLIYPMLHRDFTELQQQRAGYGNVCYAAPFFPRPNRSTSPCSLPAGPGKAQRGDGLLSAAPSALFPLPSSAGNRIIFIYQVTAGRGVSG